MMRNLDFDQGSGTKVRSKRNGRISWKQKVTNVNVLSLMQTERKIMKIVKERKLKFFGHKRHDRLLKEVIEGK